MWEDILKSVNADNAKLEEAANKIIALLGEPTRRRKDDSFVDIHKGDPYESDMVYRIEYQILEDKHPDDWIAWDFGPILYAKLNNYGTEPFQGAGESGGYPSYMVGSFHIELFCFQVTLGEDNPQVESIAQDLHNYFEQKYGITTEEFQPRYLAGSTSPEHGEGEEINVEDLPDDEWKESLEGNE